MEGCSLRLTTAILATSTAPAAAQLREGTCANAVTLFPDNNPEPGSLKLIPVPEPTNLNTYVRNRQTAIAPGKAFF